MNHPRGCNLKVTRNNTVIHRRVEQITQIYVYICKLQITEKYLWKLSCFNIVILYKLTKNPFKISGNNMWLPFFLNDGRFIPT